MKSEPALPKMMLGFVVRRYVADLGREPSPEEFAEWANHYRDGARVIHLFGRPISAGEAKVILRHRSRPVTARGAQAHESLTDDTTPPAANVTSLAAARDRLALRSKRPR